jgi:hypothetical protein
LEDFNNLQKEARENQRGLWSPSTCGGDTTKAAVSSATVSSTPPAVNKPVTQQPSTDLNTSGVVKKSKSDICHAPGTTYYDQTKNFTSYNTIQECLNSGGRLPKN